jgi:hypothetical protein
MQTPNRSLRLSFRALVLATAVAAAGVAPEASAAATAPKKPAPKTPSAPAAAKKPAPKPAAKPAEPPAAKPVPPLPVPPAVAGALQNSAPPAADPGALQPADGKWLVDEQGRQYFVTPAPRVEGRYMWLNDEHTKVRLPYGMSMDVASYDDKNFYVKIYRPEETPAPAPAAPRKTPEELAKAAASYKFDLAESRRIAFQPFADGLPEHGQWRNGFVIADMNGDGRPDIVHGPPRKGGTYPVIFLGDGKGHWKQWETTFPQVPFDYGDVAVGDLNRDGKADLVVASHLRGITALVGDGKGGFKVWSQGIEFILPGGSETSPAFSSRAIQVLDWNHDGRPDILAVGEGPRLALTRGDGTNDSFNNGARGFRIYLNQGDGTWVAKDEPGNSVFGDAIVTGDFNNDRLPDFAMGSNIMGYRAIVGYGQPDGSWKRINLEALRPSAVITALAAADFDRDGREDLAVGYSSAELGVWRTGVDILYSRSSPAGDTWERRVLSNEESRTGIFSLAAGDLDGDGARDLVALTGKGGSWIFVGDGKGWFTRDDSAPVTAGDTGCRGYHAVMADLDGDGKDELVATFAGEGMTPTGVPQCSSGGSLRAWKVAKAASGTAK